MSNLPRASVTQASLPPEYWNGIDSLYQQPNHHPQPESQQPQQPLGIDWDHPIFQQQQQQPPPPQQPHPPPDNISPPQDVNHGIYSRDPQVWQQTPLHQPLMSPASQGYTVSPQYQVPHYPQGQVTLDPSESSPFPPYSFPQSFYSHQNLPVQDAFSHSVSRQSISAQPSQPTSFQPATHRSSIPQFYLPTGYSDGLSQTTVNFPNGYNESIPNVAGQQTIDPQFLNPIQVQTNQQPLTTDFRFITPADFERAGDGKTYQQYYRTAQHLDPAGITQPKLLPNYRNISILPQDRGAPPPVTTVKKVEVKKKKTSSKKQTAKSTTKLAAVNNQSDSSASDSESSDYSDLEIEAPEPSPLPPTRPGEPIPAAQYDAIQAVWSPRNRQPKNDDIKKAIVAFNQLVKAVRDVWKDKCQAMKTAESKGEKDKVAALQQEASLQRQTIDAIIAATLKEGHPAIVENLGEHPMTVSVMYSFLLDRHQASDNDGGLTLNILKLLSHFVTMDEDVLQKTNISKLLPRLVKKGAAAVKELAQKVMDNAATSTKRKQELTNTAPKEELPSKNGVLNVNGDGNRADLVGSKRGREGENNGLPPKKRVGVTPVVKPPVKPAAVGNASLKVSKETPQDTKVASTVTARPKANIVAPKPTNLFGSLASASKRPGTSNAERAAAAAKASSTTEKKETVSAPSAKPAFSLGDIMADLNKAKGPAASKPAEEAPPETEEERKKRLRKESRRKLRVTWKPDSSLTEVRLFTHDPEEELAPKDGSRGGDVKGEGRILKLHRDMDELEEEEGVVREEELLPYHEISLLEYDEITAEDRSRSFIKRAGVQIPISSEKDAQERREATTLMVFYTSPAEYPSSPKEPPAPDPEEAVPEEVPFGDLPEHVKSRQERYYAVLNPKPAPTVPTVQPTASTGQFDIANILKVFQAMPGQQQQPAPPPPVQQPAPMSDLERTINLFRQQQQQQQQPLPPQPQIQQPPQLASSQPAAAQGLDFQQILGILNAQNPMQAPAFPQAAPPQPAIAQNLAALVSQFTHQSQQASQPQPQPSQQNQLYEDVERKRGHDYGGGYDGASDDRYTLPKRSRTNGDNTKRHPKAGLLPCKYWREGHCLKGDKCTYRHDRLD
ncbi:hypothetical protein ASPZODRAFT_18609 [Penicilliopsis zonata CBS 506.65]|uniref:C3H1-type domain-containing protein n=1 Tax=Penicilliopsis zonata CBS 506.65 TaxID=1073090 RepID=A0A1L9SBD0_9EURO|nr:hypothetical protein ASPZODRAFT_18609 [Penicilliopsis zonata CBS 506.65]OJJ44419.1 hypothetical protein ASPZODRAFT_18609 [Penicilliopsis zonata CBS 506.65]